MGEILNFFTGHESIPIEISTQQISSYFKLIFRDWCWNSGEIKEYVSYCEKQLKKKNGNVLILGSGAGRLSYDLANSLSHLNFYSLDHNPFLTFSAEKITQGELIELYDYELFPKELQLTSQKYKIQYPKLKHNNHQFILSTFPNLPFDLNSFDAIICPWFLDILDMDFEDALDHTKSYLKEDGELIFIGPANIHHSDLALQYTKEEIIQATGHYFSNINSEEKVIDYLTNPIASQNRAESVLLMTAKGKKKAKASNPLKLKAQKLKFSEKLIHYKNTNEVFYRVLKHINQDITLDELTTIVKDEFKFNDSEALFYARTIINKIETDLEV